MALPGARYGTDASDLLRWRSFARGGRGTSRVRLRRDATHLADFGSPAPGDSKETNEIGLLVERSMCSGCALGNNSNSRERRGMKSKQITSGTKSGVGKAGFNVADATVPEAWRPHYRRLLQMRE